MPSPYEVVQQYETLAGLTEEEYGQVRESEATKLGVSVENLDGAVNNQRQEIQYQYDTHEYDLRFSDTPRNPLDWLEKYTVSKEEAEQFAKAEFIIEGLIVSGHLHVIAAEPNGGKTTIFFHLSGEMVGNHPLFN